jgi:RNA polymerase sigma-70 factor, ECF subfamily
MDHVQIAAGCAKVCHIGIFEPFIMAATEMDEAVQEARRAGAEAWPGVSLGAAELASWVEQRGITLEALRDRGADLYLAAACARGDAVAVAAFDRAFLQPPGPMGRGKLPLEKVDELRQVLRVSLLAGPSPRIATFRGFGPLGAWVRVAAAREAAQMQGGERGTEYQDGVLVDALAQMGADPEFVASKLEHQAEFRQALGDCLRALGAREKTLLRMNFLDHMNIEEIGVIYRVHRATVARWLAAIRGQVFECVCQRLSLKLRSSPSEVASLVRLVRSEIDLSVARLLVDDASAEAPAAGKGRDRAGRG